MPTDAPEAMQTQAPTQETANVASALPEIAFCVVWRSIWPKFSISSSGGRGQSKFQSPHTSVDRAWRSPADSGVAAARTNSHLWVMTAVPNELSLGFTR